MKSKPRNLIRVALPWIIAIVFAGALNGYGADKVVKIGVGLPITGTCAFDGNMNKDGAILAGELYKDKLKAAQLDVQFWVEDDKSDPKEGASIANLFAGDKAVVGVVGHYNSSVTLAAAPILTRAGIAQISPGSSSPKITGFSKYLFRTQPTDTLCADNCAAWAAEWAAKAGAKNAAILYEETDYGNGAADLFAQLWPQKGGKVVSKESYVSGKTVDFSAILTKVKNSGANLALMVALYNEAALIAKQAKQLGLKIQFFGDNAQTSKEFIDLGGAAVEGWRSIGTFDPKSKDPVTEKFVKAFKAKYGKEPTTMAGQGYDAAALIIEGMLKNGPDRAKIQEYIFNVKDFPGSCGKLTFVNGDADKRLLRLIVKNGDWVDSGE